MQIIRVPRARGVKRGVTVGCRRSQKKLYSIFSAEGRSKLYVPYIVRREVRTSLELPRFVSFVRYCILSFGMPIGHKSLSAYVMKPPRAVRWFHSFVFCLLLFFSADGILIIEKVLSCIRETSVSSVVGKCE